MKKWLLLSLFSLLLWSQSKPGPFTPSETQRLKLENLQLKKVLAFREANDAVNRYNLAMQTFKEACSAIITENRWPKDVTCDEEKLTFSQSVSKPPEVKK